MPDYVMRPENFQLSQADLARMVFVGIDLQDEFCTPVRTGYCFPNQRSAVRVGKMARYFNQWGLDTAWVYCTASNRAIDSSFPWTALSDSSPLMGVKPHPSDIIIPKLNNSAFVTCGSKAVDAIWRKTSPIEMYLQGSKKDILVVAGVNRNACVLGTVVGAITAGYHVLLVRDMTSDVDETENLDNAKSREKQFYNRLVRSARWKNSDPKFPNVISPESPLPKVNPKKLGHFTMIDSVMLRREMERLYRARNPLNQRMLP